MPDEPHQPKDPDDGAKKGPLMLVGASLLFSLMSVQVKLAGKSLPVEMLVLARGVVTLVMSYVWLRRLGIPMWGNDKRLLVLRGVFGLGGLACFFFAVTELPLAEVTVIHYLNPVFTTLLAALLLREAVGIKLLFALVVSLTGTLFVTRPSFLLGGTPLPLAGSLAALGGALFSACAYVTVRKLTQKDDPHVIVFYFPLVAVPVLVPFALRAWRWPTPSGWLLLLGIGVTTQIAQVLLTRGLALVPAGRGTAIGYVQILFATTWGLLWFGEAPSVYTVVGALFIAGATVTLVRRR